VENNLYAEKTRITSTTRITDLATRAAGYGLPGIVVDGMDVIGVYEAVARAVARARSGEGPTIIETKTYRWRGHFEGDAQGYKAREEVEEWKAKDPIPRFRRHLAQLGVLSPEQADQIDREMADEIAGAHKFAMDSPFPDPREAEEDVFA